MQNKSRCFTQVFERCIRPGADKSGVPVAFSKGVNSFRSHARSAKLALTIFSSAVILLAATQARAIVEPSNPDVYTRLGAPSSSTAAELRAAYLVAIKMHHPDRGGRLADAQAVQEAYAQLTDVSQRAELRLWMPVALRALQDRYLVLLSDDPSPSPRRRVEALKAALAHSPGVNEQIRRAFFNLNGVTPAQVTAETFGTKSEVRTESAGEASRAGTQAGAGAFARAGQALGITGMEQPSVVTPAPVPTAAPDALRASQLYRAQMNANIRRCGQTIDRAI